MRFNAEIVTCDVVAFDRALSAGDLSRAAALYSGPFLDGFFLSAAPEFEKWVDAEPERYRRGYAHAVAGVAERAMAAGEHAAAVEWLHRLAAEEPYNSRVTLRLMEALAAAGDRAGAIRQARVHAQLHQEFAAAPDAEVEALAERLRTEQLGAGAAGTGDVQRALLRPANTERPAEAPPLGPPPVPTVEGAAEPPGGRWRASPQQARVAAAIALATLAAGWMLLENGARPRAAQAGEALRPTTIAVLPCANLSSHLRVRPEG